MRVRVGWIGRVWGGEAWRWLFAQVETRLVKPVLLWRDERVSARTGV